MQPAAALALLFMVLPAVSLASSTVEVRGIRNFHRVNDRLYRGAQPRGDVAYESLAKLGVDTVLDLRTRGEHDWEAESLSVVKHGMKYVSAGIRGFRTPLASELEAARSVLNDGGVVFVHCAKGKDRTGTIVALSRIERDGWTNARALAEAKERGMHFWERGMRKLIRSHRYTAPAPVQLANGTQADSQMRRTAAVDTAATAATAEAEQMD